MRGIIGALLIAPALAARSDSWDRVAKPSVSEQSFAHIDVSIPGESPDGWERKALGFKLEVLNSDDICGFGNVTLDGQVLPQTLVNGISSGKGSVTTYHKSIVTASWAFHCVNVNGVPDSQLMKFLINTVDGMTVKDTGFSVLFRQSGITEIINIETDLSVPDEILGNPDPKALEPLHSAEDRPEYNIEEDMAELDYLYAQMRELRHLIHEKERVIAHHTHEHFDDLEEEFGECDSLKCIAKAIAKEAKSAAHRLYGKISGDDEEIDSFGKPPFKKPHFKKPHFPKFPHHGPPKNHTGFPKHPKGNHTHFPHRPLPICRYPPPPPHHGKRPPPPPPGHHDHGPEFDGPHHDGPHHMPPPPEFDEPHHDQPHHMPPPPKFDGPDHMPPPPPEFDGPHHMPPPEFDGPPPKHHGHGEPSEFDEPPRHHLDESMDFDAPFEKHHSEQSHHGHENGPHNGPPDFDGQPPKHDGPPHNGPPRNDQEHMRFDGPPGPPGPGPRHGPPHFALQVVKYTAVGFLFAFLLIAIRRRACTPKRRADRQARREERHRRRAYRRAAHKHIITRILARISGDGSEDEYDDYEEKREALLASAEDGMSTTMAEDNTQLPNPAEAVGDIVIADEERAMSSTSAQPIVIPESVPISEARSLLGDFEMTMLTQIGGEELPAYEDNDGSEEGSFIADGFRYTPGSSNYSPAHSPAGSVSDILGPDSKS